MARYSIGAKPPRQLLIRVMTLVNLTVSMSILITWSTMSGVFAEPLALIAGGAPSTRPSPFEYPYAMAWAIPLLALMVTYVARGFEMYSLARLFSVTPLFLAASCSLWLYYFEGYWG